MSSSTNVGLTVWWLQNGAGTGNVVWCQEIIAGDVGDNFITSDSTEICITEAASGTSGQVQQSSFANVPFTPTATYSSLFRFGRKGADAADTLGVDACVIGLQTDYQCNSAALGER